MLSKLLCSRMKCTRITNDNEEGDIDNDSISTMSLVHKIPEYIQFETETLDTEQQTVQSTYYEEICIDRTNILDDCLLSVNQQVSHINEKVEMEEGKKQVEMNNPTIVNNKSFKYACSYSNGISSSSCSSALENNNNYNNNNCVVTSNNVNVEDDSDNDEEERELNNVLLLELEEIDALANNIEERLEINKLANTIEKQLFIFIIKSKENEQVTAMSTTTIKKKKLTLKDIVNRIIIENRKKRKESSSQNKFANLVWKKIIEKRQDFVDENAIDYSKVRSMWKKGSVSSSSGRSLLSNNDRSRSIVSSKRYDLLKKKSVKDLALNFQ